jgi:hypothetical protein
VFPAAKTAFDAEDAEAAEAAENDALRDESNIKLPDVLGVLGARERCAVDVRPVPPGGRRVGCQ